MWWLGTLLVFSVIFRCSSSAGYENVERGVRLKRSPHYPCQPYFYDRPRHFGPPPPPPPFWGHPPPPPPPYFQERQNYENEPQQQSIESPQSQANSEAQTQVNPQNQNGPGERVPENQPFVHGQEVPENKPCDTCDKGQDTAISNAKSVSGSAVAVAISGKGNNG